MTGVPIARVLSTTVAEDPAGRLAALFDVHHERLYRLARRLTSNADDALDLVQETFLRAARAPAAVPREFPSEEAWLVRVLINIRRDQWRRQAVRQQHAREVRPPTEGGEDQESAFMARSMVWAALDRLSPRRRAVLVLHELDGRTVRAIAALLGISAITVRWHLSRGRQELARIVTRKIGEVDEQR
jgi:RNA polymerase sigma factor (sigma-70 family)